MVKFLDTSSLLSIEDYADFNSEFHISSKTIEELENIKTSTNKTEELRFKAREAVRFLDSNAKYSVVFVNKAHFDILDKLGLEHTNDSIIIACAKSVDEQIEFYSEDLLCRLIAKDIFGLQVGRFKSNKQDIYLGYKEVILSDDEMASFYEDLTFNKFENYINEYLIIKNINGEVVDRLKWNGEQYVNISTRNFKSRMLGTLKPLDAIQQCAFDSINSNDITVLYGKSGCGKTTLPLSYIMQGLESQKFKKCYIIFHYEPLKGAKTLGFEKGDHVCKILNTGSLGNILSTKFGGLQFVESMIGSGQIEIIPTANIRGIECGSDDVIFCTEAQNLDRYTLKTILERCKDGCKQIYEGDILEQSDINREAGLFKMIDIFKGCKKFGCVKLKNNYRNEISELTDKL